MNTFNYVSALAGAGKTFKALDHASFLANQGFRIVIAQPSRQLIDETFDLAERFRLRYPDAKYRIKKIHSDNKTSKSVAGDIVNYLKGYDFDAGEILFVTHTALFAIPYFHRQENWILIIDEIPDPFVDIGLKLPENHKMLTDHFDLQTQSAYYSTLALKPASADHIKAVYENKNGDDVNAIFRPFLDAFYDVNRTLYVNSSVWTAIKEDRNKVERLPVNALWKPSKFEGFREVIIMGAMFEESILFQIWGQQMGVEWKPYERIQDHLRYQNHAPQPNLTITYLLEDNWSKSKARKLWPDTDDITVFDMCKAEADAVIGDRPHIIITNKDRETETDECFVNGSRVSNVSHGINTFQHIDNAVFLSALNPSPTHFKLFEMLDVTSDELADARYHQIVYQAVMRTSLRDPSAVAREKHFVVPDRRAADYLARVIPGCKVRAGTFADVDLQKSANGRPKGVKNKERFWSSPAQKSAAQTKKKTLIRQQSKLSYDPSIPNRMSLFEGKWDKYPKEFTFADADDLMNQLREMSETVLESKEANLLISPAFFVEKAGVETRRGLDNIESIHGIWLDNDGGDLSPADFRNIFPTLRMALFSTFSGGNRYRVFIPTNAPMTRDTDFIIKRLVMNEIQAHGFTEKGKMKHGFDTGKLTPSSMFYLPGYQFGKHAEAFFVENPGDEIDVLKWLEGAGIKMFREEEAIPAPVEHSKAIDPKITLKSVQQELIDLPKGGVNANLAKLAVKLKRNGFGPMEIGVALSAALNQRPGGRDHQRDLTDIVKKLTNGRLK